MKSLLIITALLGLAFAKTKDYNFNSVKYCSRISTYKDSLDSDERALVVFREPGNNAGAAANKFFSTIPDRCSMKFYTPIFTTKSRLQVRFDATKRTINDKDVTITFYDSDSVKTSKKIMEVSQKNPIGKKNTFTTTGSFLTIEVNRDAQKSKNYDMEFTIEPVSSATVTRWSLAVAVVMVARYIVL